MLLLAADTSGRDGSIAVLRGDEDETCEMLESNGLDGGAFSAQLVPQIAALLSRHGFSKTDIGGFVVVSGPGSFTGLRVGLAAIKALAEVLGKPIAAVSLLEAIALAAGIERSVTAALDAGRHQIYVGEYQVSSGAASRIKESLVTRDELLDLILGASIVTPSSEIAVLLQGAGIPVRQVPAPDLGSIAALGWKRILAGETVEPESLEANYISRTNAEVALKGGRDQGGTREIPRPAEKNARLRDDLK
jgi:tRNA threonylcarbamoyladenosine biosynthesis protein TsaB